MANRQVEVPAGRIPRTRGKQEWIPTAWYQFRDQPEVELFTFLVPNFICYTFSRGIHIQFILWVSFSLPYLFTRGAGLDWKIASILYLMFDWCHSWVANVIQSKYAGVVVDTLLQGDFVGAVEVCYFDHNHSHS